MDADASETREWLESLDAVVSQRGTARGEYLIARLIEHADRLGVHPDLPLNSSYTNTLPVQLEPPYPGDEKLERRICDAARWNAMALVQRANKKSPGIGGHLSTYASSAELYEVGFNHFFRGPETNGRGDLVYYQGHASPGIYARAFLEGRIEAAQLDGFRHETIPQTGLSAYPHPRLMPDFWQFPTVSMGLGPVSAIYQARFLRYLQHRGISDTADTRVWAFLGDGECDEPESVGSLRVAAREGLSNLTFVVNCNLQRLDGPVSGNGKIIQELEALFRGAGWRVIKVIWGPEWDQLFEKDTSGALRRRMNDIVDGTYQKFTTSDGGYIRQQLFGANPGLLELVNAYSDEQLMALRRGGHSSRKIHAAYQAAIETTDRPVCILAHTVKGWMLGPGVEGANVSHQKKSLDLPALQRFRDLLELPIPNEKLEDAPYYHPGPDSPEIRYLLERRRALGGAIPVRRPSSAVPLQLPEPDLYAEFSAGMKKGEASTTMVFARLLSKLIRDEHIGRRIVPIVPDEARTFGMDALFGQVGIYSAKGQLYDPVDKGRVLYYREAKNGQVLEEGLTEVGAMASFTAAATSYSTLDEPMIPFYVFYSMFGFQRTGDQMWACGDAMGRGFLLGATAGRTTLNGEGLQHEDGHSHVLAATHPAAIAYDVAYAFELATIIRDGMRRMYGNSENVYYYITLQNENYPMPPMPEGAEPGILQGMYSYEKAARQKDLHVQLFGSGSIMLEVLRAAQMLESRFGVSADVWGVTSYQLLRHEALACERHNHLHPQDERRVPYVTRMLADTRGPIVAASDYMTLVPEQVARWVPRRFTVLGTDGFGMSDTRKALRRHFEVDAESIVLRAMCALQEEGQLTAGAVQEALEALGIDPNKRDAMSV
jgi:pyruvate dehydrogenase E1 component